MIFHADNLRALALMEDQSFDLIYIDPPFNTGKDQTRTQIKTVKDDLGDRIGFGGRRYKTIPILTRAFPDQFDDFLEFLEPRLIEAFRVLKKDGSFFLHLDYREVHYAKVLCDQIFGRQGFINEIIWAYDYGGRPKNRWPAKHDTILWYARDPANYHYDYAAIDRIPYLAPSLVGAEKAARGKTPTDVWWHTIVPTNGKEKTGYPTQKPLGVLERLVRVHSAPGDLLLDFFAGSGTLGDAAAKHGREFVLVDSSLDAFEIMKKRLGHLNPQISILV